MAPPKRRGAGKSPAIVSKCRISTTNLVIVFRRNVEGFRHPVEHGQNIKGPVEAALESSSRCGR